MDHTARRCPCRMPVLLFLGKRFVKDSGGGMNTPRPLPLTPRMTRRLRSAGITLHSSGVKREYSDTIIGYIIFYIILDQ